MPYPVLSRWDSHDIQNGDRCNTCAENNTQNVIQRGYNFERFFCSMPWRRQVGMVKNVKDLLRRHIFNRSKTCKYETNWTLPTLSYSRNICFQYWHWSGMQIWCRWWLSWLIQAALGVILFSNTWYILRVRLSHSGESISWSCLFTRPGIGKTLTNTDLSASCVYQKKQAMSYINAVIITFGQNTMCSQNHVLGWGRTIPMRRASWKCILPQRRGPEGNILGWNIVRVSNKMLSILVCVLYHKI